VPAFPCIAGWFGRLPPPPGEVVCRCPGPRDGGRDGRSAEPGADFSFSFSFSFSLSLSSLVLFSDLSSRIVSSESDESSPH
jgi:hypothetical protein